MKPRMAVLEGQLQSASSELKESDKKICDKETILGKVQFEEAKALKHHDMVVKELNN